MRDLTAAMGITGPSLYGAFGDKSELYLKTIDHYASADACTPLVALEREETIDKAVELFLREVIRSATNHESGVKGCFIASSAVASIEHVNGAKERIHEIIFEAESRIAERFQKEIEKGVLPNKFPAKERAKLLFDIRQGYMFRARADVPIDQMLKEIPNRVELVLSH